MIPEEVVNSHKSILKQITKHSQNAKKLVKVGTAEYNNLNLNKAANAFVLAHDEAHQAAQLSQNAGPKFCKYNVYWAEKLICCQIVFDNNNNNNNNNIHSNNNCHQ